MWCGVLSVWCRIPGVVSNICSMKVMRIRGTVHLAVTAPLAVMALLEAPFLLAVMALLAVMVLGVGWMRAMCCWGSCGCGWRSVTSARCLSRITGWTVRLMWWW